MVGTPAKSSKTGLMIFLFLGVANSLRYMAAASPMGIATAMAMSDEKSVPLINGIIPKEGSLANGASFVLKNSAMDTTSKNFTASTIKVAKIPKVVMMDMLAMSIKNLGIK